MAMHNDLLGQRVGERLRVARLNKNLSQKELGELIGTSKQQIFKYENATDIPSLSRLVQLSDALNVTPFFFLEGHVKSTNLPKDTDVENMLFHAYAVLNQQSRILLLSIAEALVEVSSADRAQRLKKNTGSLRVLAGKFRDFGINP